jgi:SAM-dependent methyltransferase
MISNVTDHPYREFERSGWERAAAAYAGSFEAVSGLFATPLLDAARAQPGSAVLDVACGPGSVTSLAATRGAVAVGVDFSSSMIAEARRRHPSLSFQEADAEALPFRDNSFDAVIINFGVHHFPAVNEPDTCMRLLGEAGFRPDSLHTELLKASLGIRSAVDLVDLLEAGTVVLSATLRSQPREHRQAILASIEKAISGYRVDDGFRIPCAAILAVAIK